jgi:hypothetical protein
VKRILRLVIKKSGNISLKWGDKNGMYY